MGNNLKEIRTKIGSVKNTQKTTRAMKLVSTSKLKKAEEMAKRSRAYADKLNEVFEDIVSKIQQRGLENINSNLFSVNKKEIKKVDIIFITADKGLCGGFNAATIKEVVKTMNQFKSNGIEVRLRSIGKKGIAFFNFNKIETLDKVAGLSSAPTYDKSSEFINSVVSDFLSGKTDEVILIHNGFKSKITQELKTKTILPLGIESRQHSAPNDTMNIEPDDEEDMILDQLAHKYIEYNMYYALIDSLAAEHSARMQAMDAATKNAGELVNNLTISYNKARQEAITTELVEINAGVEAMK